jgi:threonine dehydrogenase-like Zn-dependent dehydrogenase
MGGWRFGNTIDGAQAEYLLVPDAMANLAPVPEYLTDEQVLFCPDIMSTGIGGAESGRIRIGDTVVVFAQGPIGLCATLGARLQGATRIIAVDSLPNRLAMARKLGADVTINYREMDPVAAVLAATEGKGADVGIEALGTQDTFERCLRCLRPGGTLSSLGVYSGKLTLPVDAFAAGLGDHHIVTTLCPGGKERMRRLMNVVAAGRADLTGLITHRFPLDRIMQAYELFANQRDGVLKVAIVPRARALGAAGRPRPSGLMPRGASALCPERVQARRWRLYDRTAHWGPRSLAHPAAAPHLAPCARARPPARSAAPGCHPGRGFAPAVAPPSAAPTRVG